MISIGVKPGQLRGAPYERTNGHLLVLVGVDPAGDLEVNVTKGKKLTNIRAAGADDAILLETPRQLTLETALEFINDDELVEVTPQNVRLRKKILMANMRPKRAEK